MGLNLLSNKFITGKNKVPSVPLSIYNNALNANKLRDINGNY